MSPTDLIGWVFSAASTGLSLLVLAGMVWAVSYSMGVPRVPLTVRREDGTHVPLGAPGAPPSAWYANVLSGGLGAFVGEPGRLVIADGWLSFTAAGATGPAWHVDVRRLRAQHHSRTFAPAQLDLWLPDGAVLMLEASRTPIHRWIRSNLAGLHRPREAHIFLQVLAANGAVVSSTPRWPLDQR